MEIDQQPKSPLLSDAELMEQVAGWLLKMDDADCSDQDRHNFLVWQQQHLRHAEMVAEMHCTFQQFEPLRQQPGAHRIVEHTIEKTQPDSVFKVSQLYSVFMVVGLVIILWLILPVHYWLADTHNDYHAWTEQTLPDYSEIKISGKTAYNLKFDQHRRHVELLDGNILIDVAKDAQRPFLVKTRYAQIRALGTRFMVQHSAQATVLTMLHSSTEVMASLANGQQQKLQVHAGQQVIIDANGIYTARQISIQLTEHTWQKHMLSIDLMPLDDVLAILQSYDHRTFKYNPDELKHLQVTAMLPLDGTDLSLLQKTLPIKVEPDFWGQIKISIK